MIHEAETSLEEDSLKAAVAAATLADEGDLAEQLNDSLGLDDRAWSNISRYSDALISEIRSKKTTPLVDQFLTEYGLSSDGGVQLMRLAEALSRTTDATTANELIADKIINQDWRSHTGQGHSPAMRLAGTGLHLSDKWLQWSSRNTSGAAKPISNAGNALLRASTRTAIRALSSQFVFAETLSGAIKRAAKYGKNGYLFSFDMLGEAARTKGDAAKYYKAYSDALDVVAKNATSNDPRKNHGISIKLSALHPRYEYGHAAIVVPEICLLLKPLIERARASNVQITIDAEEAERLDISMDVLATLVAMPEVKGWHGLGFVVQAYQRRALPLINWLEKKAADLDASLMIRLVKGAYWDSEIKRAQELGLESYPVYTRKETTDLSYLACAQKLLAHPDQFSPQFATHNAHTIAAIREIAGIDRPIEFQRLFGMGQQLHDIMLGRPGVVSRIYAPVGTQKDLLSYLIRRLLENGANSSFVNKLADTEIAVSDLTQSPLVALNNYRTIANGNITEPRHYLGDSRITASGYDFSNPVTRKAFDSALAGCDSRNYSCKPTIGGEMQSGTAYTITNPARTSDPVGQCINGDADVAADAIITAKNAFGYWSKRPRKERAQMLDMAAELLEQRAATFHYLAIKEAGKTWSDAVDEVREAVDFCRYYAAQVRKAKFDQREPHGVVVCISPWNFPLAIFLGQVTAALAAGNTVVAKPAEQTPLIAAEAIRLLHDAGVDPAAINLVPGDGAIVGEALVSHADTAAICFTGSTATAKRIASRLVDTDRALTPFIAETGGINAMIVDSSALLEQTVDAIISSAFQSAGQRCSALRILCLQEDIADECIELLSGAMDALRLGDPALISTDVGPVIDGSAQEKIVSHVVHMSKTGRKISSADESIDTDGFFVQPAAFELDNFDDLEQEIFGPVLHIIRFPADKKLEMIDKVNDSGYGLTLGIQSRIDRLCDRLSARADVGNIYINRNQIGAVVGTQPFGGHGLSGTGPKAGGPLYLYRLSKPKNSAAARLALPADVAEPSNTGINQDFTDAITAGRSAFLRSGAQIAALARTEKLEGITTAWSKHFVSQELDQWNEIFPKTTQLPATAGETNDYQILGRGLIVSLVQDPEKTVAGCLKSIITGNAFLQINPGNSIQGLDALAERFGETLDAAGLIQQVSVPDFASALDEALISQIDGFLVPNDSSEIAEITKFIAHTDGPILPLITPQDSLDRYVHEKTVTINTAAAGGDVSLLSA